MLMDTRHRIRRTVLNYKKCVAQTLRKVLKNLGIENH